MRPTARWGAAAHAGSVVEKSQVGPSNAIENVDPGLGSCLLPGTPRSSFLLNPRCTKADANTAAVFRYKFNACGLQGTADR
jgi:hypothetical protein